MKRTATFVLFIIAVIHLHAQNNAEIKGKIFDAELNPLEKATVSIVSQSDSLVLSYALSDKKGNFELVRVPTKKALILYISHVNSTPFEKMINLKPSETLDLDSVIMGGNLIEEVLVTSVAPIRLNGDTLEYKADYFKTRPNASVEDLLKLLPGLQVNIDGTILYQGKEVQSVRVNDKDFFVQDLKIATRNLDASLIDVVQVIKDKGESKREVLDDSDLPIVINLKMKKEFLKANFGKFYGGAATRDRYESGALLNAFRDTLQVSFIGFANNIGREGFNYSELSEYGGYGRAENNNTIYYSYGGLTNKASAGININYDIAKKLKTNILYNYEFRNNFNDGDSYSNSYYDDIQEESSSQNNHERKDQKHSVRAFFRYQIDTTSLVSFDGKLDNNLGRNLSNNNFASSRNNNTPVREGNSSSSSSNSNLDYNQKIYAEKKFENKWLLSFTQNINRQERNRENNNTSLTRYYLDSDSLFNRMNITTTKGETLKLTNNLNLQMPLGKKVLVDVYTSQSYRKDTQTEDILNKVNADQFENRADAANNKGLKTQTYSIGTRWRIQPVANLTVTAGLKWFGLHNQFDYHQKLQNRSNQHDYWLPDVDIRYKGIGLGYNRTVNPPSFYQIVVVNSDISPNHIEYASPYFENQTTDRYSLQYNKYFNKPKINFSFYVSYSTEDNDVGYARTYDTETSFSTSRNYQAGRSENYYGTANFSKTFVQNKTWKLSYAIRAYSNSMQSYSNINGEENLATRIFGNLSNSLNLSYKDLLTFSPSYGMGMDKTTFKNRSVNFRNISSNEQNLGASLHIHNIRKFKLETSYTLKNQIASLNNDRQNLHLVNASLYYPILGKGELKFSAFDIFNQNIASYLFSGSNSTTYSNQLSLRQYFMLGIVYKFLKTADK
ncbi:outer membrane beta-barrel protein [Sphingobacterium shayense]|uniref:outer membrane beta-barrel protein n=1 Tax=Sphingobacterium shayense TaxID=626343 RepID=UPI0015582C2B|nr:outer membrane beta-barrel protein [Sphingobacterium shayense]NQD70813.1 outer membrane beta-barrel protein [Sphingobacterium shayense]